MANVSVVTGGGEITHAYFGEICRLYDEVFSVAPFVWTDEESESHKSILSTLAADPTFGIVIAATGEQLIGFAYGIRLATTHGWWNDFLEPLPEDFTREWDGRTFALVDFAVDVRWRKQGIGQNILSSLLRSRVENRAILSVQPTAVDTHQIYEHLGWRRVGRKGPIEGVNPPYWDIYTREL